MNWLVSQDTADFDQSTNLVSSNILSLLEQITNKTRNIKICLYITKILDIILYYRWYSAKEQDSWTILYLVNYTFDLHDVFAGSFVAQRLTQSAKRLLMEMLGDRKEELAQNQEMSAEVNSLLGTDVIRGSKSLVLFEANTKEVKEKMLDQDVDRKIEGFNELFEVF